MSGPSSSSDDSSTELIDHLRFVLESSSSSDDSSILETILNNQSHVESLQLAMKHGQGGPPSSSRHLHHPDDQERRKDLFEGIEKMHTIASTETTLQIIPSTTKPTFGVDFGCGNTCSSALLMPSVVDLSTSSWGSIVLVGVGCRRSPSVPQRCVCSPRGYRQIVWMST